LQYWAEIPSCNGDISHIFHPHFTLEIAPVVYLAASGLGEKSTYQTVIYHPGSRDISPYRAGTLELDDVPAFPCGYGFVPDMNRSSLYSLESLKIANEK